MQKKFEKRFKKIQMASLILLLLIVAVLSTVMRVYIIQNRLQTTSGKFISTLLITYLLMSFQMIGPIKAKHIKINKPGFQFDNSNWYMPAFISQITESNIYNTTKYNKYLGVPFEDEKILEGIDDIILNTVKILEAIDSINPLGDDSNALISNDSINEVLLGHINEFGSYQKSTDSAFSQMIAAINENDSNISVNRNSIMYNKKSADSISKVSNERWARQKSNNEIQNN